MSSTFHGSQPSGRRQTIQTRQRSKTPNLSAVELHILDLVSVNGDFTLSRLPSKFDAYFFILGKIYRPVLLASKSWASDKTTSWLVTLHFSTHRPWQTGTSKAAYLGSSTAWRRTSPCIATSTHTTSPRACGHFPFALMVGSTRRRFHFPGQQGASIGKHARRHHSLGPIHS